MDKDKFLKRSALLFIATLTGGIFGYIFQLAMGRMLPVESYGEMNALMGLLVIFSIPFMTLLNFFARETAVLTGKNNAPAVRSLHMTGLVKVCKYLVIAILFLAIISPLISNFLNVSPGKVMLVLFCIFVTGPVMLNTGVVQGIQLFRSLAFITFGTSFLKFFYAVIFVWLGWGVYGVLGGLIATAITLLGYSQWIISRKLHCEIGSYDFSFKDISKYAGGIFLANLFFSILTQSDIILVKHYFTPHEAGIYASAAIIGKAVLYLPGSIVLALFPMTAKAHASSQSTQKMLYKAIGMTLLLSGSGALILYSYPEFIMGTMFGNRYLPSAPLAAKFGLAMMPMALVMVIMNYLLATGKVRFVLFLGIAATLEIFCIHFFAKSLNSIITILMFAGATSLVPLLLNVYKNSK